jgi:hypothetical protein
VEVEEELADVHDRLLNEAIVRVLGRSSSANRERGC